MCWQNLSVAWKDAQLCVCHTKILYYSSQLMIKLENAPVYKWIGRAEKFLKLFPGGEHLCALLWSKYVWKEILRRKFRGVHPPQL